MKFSPDYKLVNKVCAEIVENDEFDEGVQTPGALKSFVKRYKDDLEKTSEGQEIIQMEKFCG